jgi:hypothetical protein
MMDRIVISSIRPGFAEPAARLERRGAFRSEIMSPPRYAVQSRHFKNSSETCTHFTGGTVFNSIGNRSYRAAIGPFAFRKTQDITPMIGPAIKTVGVIGLGKMGDPIARHLADQLAIVPAR